MWTDRDDPDQDIDRLRQEIERLSRQLGQYQYEYYVLSKPSLSDREYDILFDRLLALEKEFPDLRKPDSPTQRVGSDLIQELPEDRHTIPVLSLDKADTLTELNAWIEKAARNSDLELSFFLEEKIDGASIVLYYEDGLLAKALTRGNGLIGNDVTGNVKTIGAVPLSLPKPLNLSVRGEIFLSRKIFNIINKSLIVYLYTIITKNSCHHHSSQSSGNF